MHEKWYGFDIDGTIADNSAHTFGMGKIGKPVKPMCDLMKKLHAQGRCVKIFTARLSDVGSDPSSQQAVKEHIWKWCDENLGFRPEITDRKDYMMECLYDDRAKQVVRNTGECLEDLYKKLVEEVKAEESAGGNPRDTGEDWPRRITAEESAIIGAKDAVIESILKSRSNLDRIRGCLFGGAVGDALGYPVEFMDEPQIRAHFGKDGIRGYELDPGTGKALISDDTQMTLFTATGILVGNTRGNLRRVMGELWTYAAQHYEDWIRTQEVSLNERRAELREERESGGFRFQHSWLVNEPRLYHRRAPGMTCLSGIRKRIDVKCPHDGPSKHPINDSKGCGGVMRVAPIGLYFSNFDRERFEDSHAMEITDRQAAEAAAFTHSHSLGYMPAAVLAHVVNRLVYPLKGRRKPMSVKDAVCEARDAARRLFAADGHIGELVALIDRAIALAEGGEKDIDCIHELGEGWVGDEALAIAIFCALRHHKDFSAGVIAAVNHRGDSDSTGAITGNILGAHLGYAAIDDKWKENLELSDVILELSGDLCRKCQMHERGPKYDSVWMSKYGCVVPEYVISAR